MNSEKKRVSPGQFQCDRDKKYELPQQIAPSGYALRSTSARLANAVNPHVDRFLSRDLDLSSDVIPESLTNLAESFHSRFFNQKPVRLSSIKSILENLGWPDNVIVTIFCRNFFPLFENWLASCDHNGIDVRHRLITFTLDNEAYEKTLKLDVHSYCFDPDEYISGGGSMAYGDKEFCRTMYYKNAIISEMLELGVNVLFQDVDLIWLRDPYDYFSVECTDDDVYIMYDGPNPNHRPLYANTGFVYAKSTEGSKALFETALRNSASIFKAYGHQKPFNRIMALFILHNVLGVKVLPENLFLNGHLFNLKQGLRERAGNWKNEGFVVHYSWTGDRKEKREKIIKFGLGYLPDAQLFANFE